MHWEGARLGRYGSHMQNYSPEEIRDDFVPKADILDRRFHELEKEHLWPKVWQIACREAELPNVGDYIVYEIIDDAIVVVRHEVGEGVGNIRAYHNVCPHRGNLLVEGTGNAKQFVCSFHGWRFGTDGRNIKVIDRHDWGGCLSREDTDLGSCAGRHMGRLGVDQHGSGLPAARAIP